MKKLFSLFAALLFVGSMMASVGDLYYTLSISQQTGNEYQSYAGSHDFDVDGMTWAIPGNLTFGDYWAIGGKSLTSYEAATYSKTAMGDAIAKIVVSHSGTTSDALLVDSVVLIVASDASFAEAYVLDRQKQNPEVKKNTAGTVEFEATTSWAKDAYYKISFFLSNSKNNNYRLPINNIVFYSYLDPSTPAITAENVSLGLNPTSTGTFEKSVELDVVGANLSEAISYTQGANTAVSGTLTAEGGKLTLSVNTDQVGEFSDSFILSSGSVSKEVTITANIIKTDGNGTKDKPFSVADVVKLNNEFSAEKQWVLGYIVGCAANGGALATSYTASNIALGDDADQTTACVPVELPSSGTIRTELNLSDNAGNLHKQVKVYGQLVSYFTYTGVKSTSDYEFVEAAAATYDVTPELNPNGTITATPNADVEEGTTVTLTATPNDGYEFEENSWVVKRVDNNEEVAVTNNQFIMPASNVTVAATFNLIPDAEPWCEKATGHQNNADFGDPNGRILLTIEKVEGTNNLKVTVKNNNENGNTKTGLNFLWVNAVDATNNNATYGSHETEDTEEVSVIVEFSEAKDTYTFNNIHWAYSGWTGEWAIDGLTVQASELCEQATPIIPETYELTFSEGQLEYDTDYNQWYYELSEYDENDNFKSAFILWADGEANVRPTSVTDINTIDAEYSYFIVVKAPGDTLLSYENGSLADINISMSYSEEQQLEQQGQIYTYIIMTISGQATDEAGNTYIINESQVIMILDVQAAPLSLAEFIEAAPTEAVELKDLTVIFASGKNTYVIDEEGTALVMYDANKTYYDGTLTAGKVLSGQQATYTIYNNQDEIIPANTVVATDGVVPVPTLLNAQPTTEQVNKYVRLEGVEAVANGNFYYAYDGDLQLYGATGSLKPSKDGIYNLEGIIINFKGTQLELIVTAIEEVPATSIDGINNAKSVRKLIENNQVIILRDGKRYNVVGIEVK